MTTGPRAPGRPPSPTAPRRPAHRRPRRSPHRGRPGDRPHRRHRHGPRPDRRTAPDDLTRRNTAALDLIDGYGAAVERLGTGAFTVTPELTPHGHRERIRAYHGHVHVSAELNDFTALGELTTRLADLELTRVDGPWRALRPDSPAPARPGNRPYAKPLQRAREYAETLGATLTALVELDDTGADDTDRRSRAARSVSRAAPDGTEAAGGPDPLAPEPGRRHIHARIDARFTMAPPRLQTIPVTRSDENSRPARNRPPHFSPGCSSERSTAQFNTCQYRFT
ncbi:SIMPL domain-containing protein [Streptomyces sp. NPDC057746]|uniref:SIMPL domain-containing protein n=1 Tax=Streptomyces sp. NPDC057746 TaxID=3346237 RepID=UPI0036D00E15